MDVDAMTDTMGTALSDENATLNAGLASLATWTSHANETFFTLFATIQHVMQ